MNHHIFYYGMKDATEPEIIPQESKEKNNRLIFRSKNEDGGIEFSYSFWMYIKMNLKI